MLLRRYFTLFVKNYLVYNIALQAAPSSGSRSEFTPAMLLLQL